MTTSLHSFTRYRLGAAVVFAAALAALPSDAFAALQCPGPDDAFEDNDNCADAVALPEGITAGLYTETSAGDSDFFSFQIPAHGILSLSVSFIHADGNIDTIVYGGGCGNVLGAGFSNTDNEFVEVVNSTNAPLDLTFEVFVSSTTPSDCGTYDLELSVESDPCATVADDGWEDNDDCGSAALMGPGTYPGLVVFQSDLDYFQVEVGAGAEVQIDAAFLHDQGDVNLFLYDPAIGCGGGFGGSPVAFAITPTDDESLSWVNSTVAPLMLVLEVSLSPLVASGCNGYDLSIAVTLDGCLGPDDALEDNDDCGSALPLVPGIYNELFVSENDPDFYSVLVSPGDVLGVDCAYAWLDGALAVLLWDPAISCGTGPYTSEIARGITPLDNERVFWLNETGSTKVVIIEVRTAAPELGRCNTYELKVETFPDPCPGGLGQIFCRGVANSTGLGSSLCASGSDSASDNDVTLSVTGLPLNASCYFVVSQDPTITLVSPVGSSGQLCVASPAVGRQAPVLNSGTMGRVELMLDLASTPQPSGPVAIAPGETWSWQLWHRDQDPTGAPTSNFSSARSVMFR